MKLLGFITGMVLIGVLGAWYMQEKPRHSWPLTEAAAPIHTDSPPEFAPQSPGEKLDKHVSRVPEEASSPPPQERLALQEPEPEPESTLEDTALKEALEQEPPLPARARPALQLSSPQEQEVAAPILPLPEPLRPTTDPAEHSGAEPAWQVFWEPFQTELSARGFAQRLQETTGLEIKVDKQAANAYLVLFPYTSEEERQHHIDLIEARTSLKLKLSGPP
jgi:hypothetical protein